MRQSEIRQLVEVKSSMLKKAIESNAPKREVVRLLFDILSTHLKWLEAKNKLSNGTAEHWLFIEVFNLRKEFEIRIAASPNPISEIKQEIVRIEYNFESGLYLNYKNAGDGSATHLLNEIEYLIEYDIEWNSVFFYKPGEGVDRNFANYPKSGESYFWIVDVFYHNWIEDKLSELLSLSSKPEIESGKLLSQAKQHLQIFNGSNVHGRKIMSDADFQRLCGYVETMIEKDGLPDDLEPIAQVDFPNTHIRYLFYKIHAELYTTKEIKEHFIEFIHAVFKQFTGKRETTKAKFSEKPKSWDADMEKISR